MLTSAVIGPAERRAGREGRERRDIHSLMTTTNSLRPLFRLYRKTAKPSVGIASATLGPIKLVLFKLQTWPRGKGKKKGKGIKRERQGSGEVFVSC